MKRFILSLSSFCLLSAIAVRAQGLPIPFELFREGEPRLNRLEIQPEWNPSVRKWIRFFSVDDRDRFARFMRRGALYKNLVQDILVQHGVPAEMYYLAMIESGFSRGARSSAKAVGIWQFMPSTARLYGLRVDREVDERLDVIRSTQAAARHLRELKREFGNWHLAMAAYNCGAGCVQRAVRRHRTENFWRLASRDALPDETINYIPKFQAAMAIARNPEHFGFPRYMTYDFPVVNRVRFEGRVDLEQIARSHRLPITTVLAFNPHLLKRRTPSSGYEVWLPRQSRRS